MSATRSESLIHKYIIHLWLCTTVTACVHAHACTRVRGNRKESAYTTIRLTNLNLGSRTGRTHSSERAHEAHDDKIRATRGRAKHAATAEGATGPRPVRCTNERRAHHETDRTHAHTTTPRDPARRIREEDSSSRAESSPRARAAFFRGRRGEFHV